MRLRECGGACGVRVCVRVVYLSIVCELSDYHYVYLINIYIGKVRIIEYISRGARHNEETTAIFLEPIRPFS